MSFFESTIDHFFINRAASKHYGPIVECPGQNEWMWKHPVLGRLMEIGHTHRGLLSTEQTNLIVPAAEKPEFFKWILSLDSAYGLDK
jgi:phosphopantothenoylcysteine synthetase/decarboxylase